MFKIDDFVGCYWKQCPKKLNLFPCLLPLLTSLKAALKDVGWTFNVKPKEAEDMEAGGNIPEKVVEKCKDSMEKCAKISYLS